MLYPGLVSVTFRQLSAERVVRLAQKAGLAGIEWGGDVHVPHGELGQAKRVRRLTERAGLQVVSYGSYYRVGHPAEVAFKHVLLTAVSLGAPVIRVWAGKRPSAPDNDIYRHQVMIDAQRIVQQASRHNIEIAFEYHQRTLCDTPASTTDLLQRVGKEGIKSLWQPQTGLGFAENLMGLRQIQPWLAHCHVFSWRQTQQTVARLPLAAHEAVWLPYLGQMAADKKNRFALLEFVQNDSPTQFLEDAATLVDWLKMTNSQHL